MNTDTPSMLDWIWTALFFLIAGAAVGITETEEERIRAQYEKQISACREATKNTEAYVRGFTAVLNQQPVVVEDQVLYCKRRTRT